MEFAHPTMDLRSNILAFSVSPTRIKIIDLASFREIKSVTVERGFGSILLDPPSKTLFYVDVEKGKYLTSFKNGCLKFIEFQ
jgi:hypothetical protein